MRILLGQLGSNGDCLYATTLARQIKHDHPDSELVWAISSICRPLLIGNPYIDSVWEVPLAGWADAVPVWHRFEQEARERERNGEFDRVVLSQISPGNFRNYDGTIRPSIFRAYDRPITVPVETVLNLTDAEEEKVARFCRESGFDGHTHRILFECSSKSGQSYVDPEFALAAAGRILERLPDCCLVLSSHLPVAGGDARIIDGSVLTLRENAALARRCTLFIGCGSGLTVTALAATGPELPMIEVLAGHTSVYASFVHDYEHFGLPTGRFIEMPDATADAVAECAVTAMTKGAGEARARFHTAIPLHFGWYWTLISTYVVRQGALDAAAQSLLATAARYGWLPELRGYADELLALRRQDQSHWDRRLSEELDAARARG